eukprot:CAMPEP_0194667058 /NCGR_PEP_ID=MMETSP0295-20121207/3110_1 /TAXON_ID=39354 /ORGANISM="Heterosigma akashiwo, Strain CCMP2393" /LENGTH=117 /DNA_ID=CAMNT_0039549477 /DNA_START=71 /DNA_END=420 /DNA_ORIENTATION=-
MNDNNKRGAPGSEGGFAPNKRPAGAGGGGDMPVHMRPGFVPTKPCRFFSLGQCTKGSACTYIHGPAPTGGAGAGSLGYTALAGQGGGRPCYEFKEKGSCKFGATCKFDHGGGGGGMG